MNSPILVIFQFIILIFSAIIHEVSHGWMALSLGDETAKREGRLTLNPISHIDLMGTIILPVMMVALHSPVILGWAKPVPYNPMALYKDFRYGPLKVALAGPFSNLLLAIFFGLTVRIGYSALSSSVIDLLISIVLVNSMLFVFNLVPIPPLDSSKILTTFLPREYAYQLERFSMSGILLVFIFLLVFPVLIQTVAISLTSFLTGAALN